MQFLVGAAFVSTEETHHYRQAGYMEWILCYLGSFWLLSFVGFTK